jgi:hypothetical protein
VQPLHTTRSSNARCAGTMITKPDGAGDICPECARSDVRASRSSNALPSKSSLGTWHAETTRSACRADHHRACPDRQIGPPRRAPSWAVLRSGTSRSRRRALFPSVGGSSSVSRALHVPHPFSAVDGYPLSAWFRQYRRSSPKRLLRLSDGTGGCNSGHHRPGQGTQPSSLSSL